MGLTDLFKRGRSSSLVLGPRRFSLKIAGHGVEATPHLPATVAHLADGTLVFGPHDVQAARAQGEVKNVLIRPGTPPSAALERRAISEHSIVTYSTAERGSTQLVLGTGMQRYDDVLAEFHTTSVAAADGGWRIVTDNHEFTWPATLSLRVTGNLGADHGPYQLALDGSATDVIEVYGPLAGDKIPAAEQLNAVGLSRLDAGSVPGQYKPIKYYAFEGDASAQRYYYVHLEAAVILLIRARASAEAATPLFAAAEVIASSLIPRY